MGIAHLSTLWWEIISDCSRPLALLQWPVKDISINHLWLLKEPDSRPPEIVGLHLREAKRGGWVVEWEEGVGGDQGLRPALQSNCAVFPQQHFEPV